MAKLPEEVIEALESGETKCVLATVNEDGSLNLVPVGSMKVIGDEKLAYACCFDGRTTGNLKEGRKKVAIAIWKPRLEGFQVKGTLQDMHDSGEIFDEFSSMVNPMMETMGIDCRVHHVAVIKVTEVYDTYWRFAAERQAVFFRKMWKTPQPWTQDPILTQYKFTNAYRASDRVSQYLIRRVIYGGDQDPEELLFRILLDEIFDALHGHFFPDDGITNPIHILPVLVIGDFRLIHPEGIHSHGP